jgi:arylsulfatase A-like enzyme
MALAAPQRPNILFLYSDDHHFQCLGAAGNPHIHTPNLDRLASRGVNFTNGIITTPQCCPSRGVMISGLETYQSGLLSNGATSFKQGLGPSAVEQLRRGGYETVLIGKWHIRNTPAECGFAKAPLWLRGGSSIYQDPKLRRGLEGADEATSGHITDLFTDAGIDYIRSARRPFLLWMAYNAPHSPLFASGEYRKRYEGKDQREIAPPFHPREVKPSDWITYYSVITHLDEAIGRLIGALEQAKLWESTLIVFLGDNGFLFGSKGLSGKVYPWEESIRVPYIASGGMVRARGRSDAPVASVDLPATFLDYAGLTPEYPLAGRSIRVELATGRSGKEAAFAAWADGRPEALSVRRAVEPYRLARSRTHKYILWESGREGLFDLRSDPQEERDLAAGSSHAKTREYFRELLAARMKNTGDPAAAWISRLQARL